MNNPDKICHCPVCDPEVFKRWFGHYPEELPGLRTAKAKRKARREELTIWKHRKAEQRRKFYEKKA